MISFLSLIFKMLQRDSEQEEWNNVQTSYHQIQKKYVYPVPIAECEGIR